MVLFSKLTTALAVTVSVVSVTAHPGEVHDHAQVKREIQVRDHLASKAARSLGNCAGTIKARALEQRAITRRAATAERLRKARGITMSPYLHRRDLAALQKFETVNHNYTGTVNPHDPSAIFSANTSCVLTPENTIGPYYVIGELLRENVAEDQAGVPMHLEMQFIDTNTCEPVPRLLIDIWSCNATGTYSGIDVASGQAGLNTTFLRGLQQSDSDGVVQFDTIFPGHYDGRAIHEHVVVHTNAQTLRNGSWIGGTYAHIGQLFFDESLRSAVEATYPYNTNTQAIVSNDDDMWAPTQADNNYDPFPEFVYLSDDITDGLLAWISIGIDTTANHTADASYAAYYDATGGHNNANGGVGGAPPSGSGPPPNGAISTGSVKRSDYNKRKMFSGAGRRAA